MADLDTNLEIGYLWQGATVTEQLSATATADLKISRAFKDSSGAVITGYFILGVENPTTGNIQEIFVPASAVSADGLTLGSVAYPLVRGIKNDASDPTDGDSDFSEQVEKGWRVFVSTSTVLLRQIYLAVSGVNGSGKKFNAPPTFLGEGIIGDRVFADATARDAAITSPVNGMSCYNTAVGVIQKYEGGVWVNSGTSTTPNASKTVAGKVELGTDAEVIAGTDTGATGAELVATPSQLAANTQNASYIYAADAEASDTYAITLVPAVVAYAVGQEFNFKANTANTGAATLNVNALGAIAIKKLHDQDLENNDIESGAMVKVIYDGTNFQIQTPSATNISAANAVTLTGGGNANSVHRHAGVVGTGVNNTDDVVNFVIPLIGTTQWTVDGDASKYAGSWGYFNNSAAAGSLITANAIYSYPDALSTDLRFDAPYTQIVVEFSATFRAGFVSDGDNQFGLAESAATLQDYDSQNAGVAFSVDTSGNLYAHTGDGAGGNTEDAITGITLTNSNKYRIEYDKGSEARFYVNGVLESTITTTLPVSVGDNVKFGAGLLEGVSSGVGLNLSAPQFKITFS